MSTEVEIGGGRIDAKAANEAVDKSKDLGERLGIEILLIGAKLVFGKDHIESALEHAARAFERGENVASTKMMETLLYASGERQLSTAIGKMGVTADTREVAVLVSDNGKLEEVLASLGIKRDDSALEGRLDMLKHFGISEEAIKSVPKEKVFDLVLERVALVDTLK